MATDSVMPTIVTPKAGDIITLGYIGDDGASGQFTRRVREVVGSEDGRLTIINESATLIKRDGSSDRLSDIVLESDGVTCRELYRLTGRSVCRHCRLVGVNLPR